MAVNFFEYDSRWNGGEIRADETKSERTVMPESDPGSAWSAALGGVASPAGAIDPAASTAATSTLRDWSLLLGEDPDAPPSRDALDLNRPVAAARYLVDNWERWNLPDGLNQDDLRNPSKGLPPDAREVMRYIGQNPAVFSALDSGGGRSGMNDGDIWRFDAADFADKAREDLGDAVAAFGRYLRNNPVAGVDQRLMARDVALLAANRGLLTAAGPTQFGADGQRPMTGEFDARSLESLRQNTGLGDALLTAAARMEARGLSRALGGPSGPVDVRALTRWLETA
jgi:hypothetical protein